MSDDIVQIYTDGACSGNPGPGGWGALLRYKGHEKELSGGEEDTTNNRMELTAAIEALKSLTKQQCQVELYTDSKYVMDGITQWIEGWKKRGWRTAAKKDVKNRDLWELLDAEIQKHNINWHWVKGHAGHTENEIVDNLARLAVPRG